MQLSCVCGCLWCPSLHKRDLKCAFISEAAFPSSPEGIPTTKMYPYTRPALSEAIQLSVHHLLNYLSSPNLSLLLNDRKPGFYSFNFCVYQKNHHVSSFSFSSCPPSISPPCCYLHLCSQTSKRPYGSKIELVLSHRGGAAGGYWMLSRPQEQFFKPALAKLRKGSDPSPTLIWESNPDRTFSDSI